MFGRKKQDMPGRHMPVTDQPSARYTYHSNRTAGSLNRARVPESQQSETPAKEKRSWLVNIPTFLILLVIACLVLYSLTLTREPRIEIVQNSNINFVQPDSVYKAAADKIFGESLLNRTKLTINTDKIADEITKQFPEIERSTVVVPFVNRTPVIELLPASAVCVLSNSQGYFAIDQDGNAILKLDKAEVSKLNLPVVIDQSGLNIAVGKTIVTTSTISFIGSIIDEFNAKHIPIQSMTLVNVPYELNLAIKGEPYYVKFNLLGNPRLEAGTYFATLKQLQTTKTTPSQYIDVRVQGRAYYQ